MYKILLVEDDRPLADAIKSQLESSGYTVVCVTDFERVTEEFAQAIADMPKVCDHFHLSLQSGCDKTLKNMNRKYTADEYAEGCVRP